LNIPPAQTVGYAAHDSVDDTLDTGGKEARLHGWVLATARGAWLVIATLTFIMVLVSFPAEYERFRTPCTGPQCTFLTLKPNDLADLSLMGLSLSAFAVYVLVCKAAFTAVSLAVGMALFWRRSNQLIALLVALALVTLGGSAFASQLDTYLGAFGPFWRTLALVLSFLGNTLIVLCFYLFPNGRFTPSWIKGPAALFVILQADGYFLNSTLFAWAVPFNLWILLAYLASIVCAQVYRYFRVSSPTERQQIKWVVLGLTGTVVVSQFVELALPQIAFPHLPMVLIGNMLYSVALLLIPLSIGTAILRYRLWDIDILINRTLVYAALTSLVILLYVVIVRTMSEFLQVSGSPIIALVATGVIAVLFQPLRERLQRAANRLLYGERDDPYHVLSRLGRRLGEVAAPGAVLPNVVESIVQALKVPYATIALKQGDELRIVAAYGQPVTDLIHLPLVYQGEPAGELAVARRTPGEAFSKMDMGLLHNIANEAGMAAHAVQLTADLQRSRERLVTTREEERRRLRRDLHDGLGPVLGALTLKLDAARNLLATNPEAVDKLLLDLKTQAQGAIADIRRLVYELRPPALDDLGLASALREYASQCGSLNGLSITVEIPEMLEALPAAVEVAAYRTVQEGLNNIVRHARASNCLVRVGMNGSLDIEITDDGVGMPPDRRAGIGLISMRERAEELGGSFVINTGPQGGTHIVARLPLAEHSIQIIATPSL
jgi:signal transduction histidine kinase